MAAKIDDSFHAIADALVSAKYTGFADARQRSMGLSYVTAEKEDLVREFAAFARAIFKMGQEDEAAYGP